jgi:hypothetical protein
MTSSVPKPQPRFLLAAGTNRSIPVTLDFGGCYNHLRAIFQQPNRDVWILKSDAAYNPRQFHIEAIAGNSNLNVHLVVSRLCELAPALLAGSLRESISHPLAVK